MTRRRLTQAERKAKTRERLLQAAYGLFANRGYHAASVDDVAAKAGYSTGAVYAHFASKEDLFLELVEEHVSAQIDRYRQAVANGLTLEERARAGADEWMDYLDRERDYFPLFIAYWSYALRSRRLRPTLVRRLHELRGTVQDLIDDGAADLAIPVPEGYSERLATIVTALGNGLALHKLADPEAVPDELFGDTLVLFLGALAGLAQSLAEEDVTWDSAPQGPDSTHDGPARTPS